MTVCFILSVKKPKRTERHHRGSGAISASVTLCSLKTRQRCSRISPRSIYISDENLSFCRQRRRPEGFYRLFWFSWKICICAKHSETNAEHQHPLYASLLGFNGTWWMLEHNRVDELVKEGDENVVLWMSAGYNVSSSANHKHVQDICTKRGTSRSYYTLINHLSLQEVERKVEVLLQPTELQNNWQ